MNWSAPWWLSCLHKNFGNGATLMRWLLVSISCSCPFTSETDRLMTASGAPLGTLTGCVVMRGLTAAREGGWIAIDPDGV